MALIFCRECNEPIAQTIDKRGQFSAWMYAEKGYCAKHPAPAGPREPPRRGQCDWSTRLWPKGHTSSEVWYVPSRDRNYCSQHLADLVRDAIKRGRFGK